MSSTARDDHPVHVLIAGGGVAALEAALALRALAGDLVTVELLAPEPSFWYRPSSVAEPFELGETKHFELPELASAAGARFSLGELAAVDTDGRVAHTAAGGAIPYDVLLLACGALPVPALPGALTFRGPADVERLRGLLDELATGSVERVAFVIPWGAGWPLPAYELALMTAAFVDALEVSRAEVVLVTPEDEPLGLFGPAGTKAVRELLDERGIVLHTGTLAREAAEGELRVVRGRVRADRVVALPRLRGPRIDGVPQTRDGFVPVDRYGHVSGLADVFAAGDVTTFPTKQGGIAAQQADAAAHAIAVHAGADLDPEPFRPVLRGLLLTGGEPRYLRRDTAAEPAQAAAAVEPLWWPPAKVVGRYLAPFLGESVAVDTPLEDVASGGAVRVERELARDASVAAQPPELAADDEEGGPTVAEIMSAEPLVVAPEDTLGEVAERLRRRDAGSALVVDHGRLIGILTSRDLLRAFAARVHPSDARVRQWMTAEPIVAAPDLSAAAAVTVMTEHGIHHLPVVEGARAVGVVGLRQAVRRTPQPVGVGLGF